MGSKGSKPAPYIDCPPPEKLSDFKDLAIAPEQYNIPEVPLKRRATDSKFIVIFLVTLVLFFPCMIYTLSYADIDRYIHGSDNCGNVCGRNNEFVPGINCSGRDMRKLEYLKYLEPVEDDTDTSYVKKMCVKSCNSSDSSSKIVKRSVPAVKDEAPPKLDKDHQETESEKEETKSESDNLTHKNLEEKHEKEPEKKIHEKQEEHLHKPDEKNETDKSKTESEKKIHEEAHLHKPDEESETKIESDDRKPKEDESKRENKNNNSSVEIESKKVKDNTESEAEIKMGEKIEYENEAIDDVVYREEYERKGYKCYKKDVIYIEASPEEEDDNVLMDTWSDFSSDLDKILGFTLLSFGISCLILILFRFATAFVVWGIVVGCYVILVIFVICIWVIDADSDSDSIVAKIFWTLIFVLVSCFAWSMFKRIPLVISIFREATKAIFSMPLILLQPALTFLALLITLLLFLLTLAYMATSGTLTHLAGNFYDYQPNGFMTFTMFFNFVITIWMVNFIIGCHTMIISGAVSAWYFARDKSFMGSPIKDSYRNLFKYHLGSVAFGSLIITAADILRCLVKLFTKNKRCRVLTDCCINLLETLLVYICKNAYIEVAMHGEPFYKSGKRAVRLLRHNLSDVIAINSVGDFVLAMAKLLIVLLTACFAFLILDTDTTRNWFVMGLTVIIAIFLANCMFSVFNTAIDTIFLCYCEDCDINDGVEHPYYMTTDLMQFFQESKRVVETKTETA